MEERELSAKGAWENFLTRNESTRLWSFPPFHLQVFNKMAKHNFLSQSNKSGLAQNKATKCCRKIQTPIKPQMSTIPPHV